MSYRYQIVLDKPYARKLIKRYAQSGPFYRRISTSLSIMIAAACATVAFFAVVDRDMLPVILPTMGYLALPIAILLLVGLTVGRARQVRRILAFTKSISVTLSDESVATVTDTSRSESAWTAFNRADRYDDGVMLVRYVPSLWLPDSSLIEGKPDEVTTLIATKLPLKNAR